MKNILVQCFAKKDAAPGLALSMAKGFADGNNQVFCAISDQIENLDEWLSDDRLNVTMLDTGNKRSFLTKALKLCFVTRRELKRKYAGIDFDLSIQPFVHPFGVIFNSAINAKHKMGICHDPNPHTGESFINRFFSYMGYSSTSELIVLTRSFIDIVKEKYKKPVYYMKLGLLSNCRRADVPESADDGKINFLFFGRIEKYKGIEVLINAYSKMCSESTTLTIAGNGDFSEYEPMLTTCTNVNVINRYIQDDEIGRLFSKKNTILVVPYIDATQSGVIAIAVNYKVPVIASDTGGLREQLDDGKIGVLVEPGDVEGLAEAMNQFVKNADLYDEQSQKMAAYKPNLEWATITKKLLEEVMEG